MTDQRLFISHASEDGAVVGRIVTYLETHGVPCWLSSRDIPPRAIYADAITQGIQACSACAVIQSGASNQSKAVKRELELASHYDKPFIPIRIDATEPAAGLDYYLRNTQWMDFKRDGERALDRIITHMKEGASSSVHPAPSPPAADLRKQARAAALVAGIVVIVALGGWTAWSLLNRVTSPQIESTASEPSAAALATAETTPPDTITADSRSVEPPAANAPRPQIVVDRVSPDAVSAQGPPASLIGNWVYVETEHGPEPGNCAWSFAPGGRFTNCRQGVGGSWTQEGRDISFTMDSNNTRWSGRIDGDTFVATSRQTDGNTVRDWRFVRR